MNFGCLSNVPWFKGAQPNNSLGTGSISTSALMEQPKPKPCFDIKLWRWSFSLYLPGAVNNGARFQRPTTINRELKRRAQFRGVVKNGDGVTDLRFRPYVSKVPWHTGVRGFLSQLFPRYGHYCGPNWSSGKDGGSHVWDKRPIDWLDFCCYCHDIGYDTHDQAELLKADLAFLECLERPHMSTKGDARVAHLYKTMCTTGIRKFLIPYRTYLVKLRSRQPLFQFEWLNNVRWRSRNFEKT